jgi:putative transposase
VTFHPSYLATGPDPAQRHREWLQQALPEEDLQAIRIHLRQERALGDPRFQAMAAKTLNRPVAVRPRGRPLKDEANSPP